MFVAACTGAAVARGVTAPAPARDRGEGDRRRRRRQGHPRERRREARRRASPTRSAASPRASTELLAAQLMRDAETGSTGRVLGLDLGDARIGVAISDPERRLAVPVGTIHVGQPPGRAEGRRRARRRARRDRSSSSGFRCSMSGDRGAAGARTRGVRRRARGVVRVPIEFQDERLSTVEADARSVRRGVTGRERRRVVDRSAATVILQAWLDAHR